MQSPTLSPAEAGPVDHLPTRDGYDRWAAIYDDEQNPLVAIEEPLLDHLLGDVRGLSIADLGCGTGRHSLRLAKAGASVTGVDFSEEMLNKARVKAHALPCVGVGDRLRFMQHDLLQPLPLKNQSFDRVLCGLVVDHIPDLACLFASFKRICKPSPQGFIVISTMHPAMMLRGVQARFTDPLTGRETRPGSVAHQISDYVMAATRAGLTIDHMSEHAVDEALAKRCPRAEKYIGWPILLLMRLTY